MRRVRLGRPRRKPGTWGSRSCSRQDGKTWRARARYTDLLLTDSQVTATGRTKILALAALDQRLLEIREQDLSGPGHEPHSVMEVFEAWKAHTTKLVSAGDVKAQTVEKNRRHLEKSVLPAIGQRPIAQVRVSELEHIIDGIVAEGFRRKAQLVRVSMVALWSFAVRHDQTDRNIAESTTRPKVKRKPPVAKTAPELTAVRQAILDWENPPTQRPGPRPNGYLLAGFDLMLGTGIRIGEAMALRWEQVDLDDQPRVRVVASLHEIDGKVSVGETKTDASHRSLVLPPNAVESLRKIRPAQVEKGAHVFAARSGKPTQPGNWRRSLRSAIQRAGLDAELVMRPHDLRKTVGTRLERTAGIDMARRVLGHAPDSKVTYKHYIEPQAEAPDVSAFLESLWGDDQLDGG